MPVRYLSTATDRACWCSFFHLPAVLEHFTHIFAFLSCLVFTCFCALVVPCRKNLPFPEAENYPQRQSWCHRCRLQCCHSRVPDRRGSGACRYSSVHFQQSFGVISSRQCMLVKLIKFCAWKPLHCCDRKLAGKCFCQLFETDSCSTLLLHGV